MDENVDLRIIALLLIAGFFAFYVFFGVFQSSVGFADELQYSIIAQEIAGIRPVPGQAVAQITFPFADYRSRMTDLGGQISNKLPLFRPQLMSTFMSLFYMVHLAPELLPPLLGAIALYIVFLLGAKLVNREAGVFSVLLLGMVPIFVEHSILAYTDMLVAMTMLASLYFFWNGITGGGKRQCILSGVLLGISLLSKETAVIMLPIYLILGYGKTGGRDLLKQLLVVLVIGGAIAAPFYIRTIYLIGTPSGLSEFGGLFKLKYPDPVPDLRAQYGAASYKTDLLQPDTLFHFVPMAFIFMVFAGYCLTTGAIRKDLTAIIIAFMALFVLMSHTVDMRHMLFVISIAAIFGGCLINGLGERYQKRKKIIYALAIIGVLVFLGIPALDKAQMLAYSVRGNRAYMGAMEWISQNTTKDAVILTPWEVEVNYYTGRTGAWFVGWGMKDLPYYFDHPEIDPTPYLRKWGIDYVMIHPVVLSPDKTGYYGGILAYPQPWALALSEKADVVYNTQDAVIFKLKEAPNVG